MAAPGEVIFDQELHAKRKVSRKDGVDCHNECETLSIVMEKAPGSSSLTSSCDELWNRMNAGTVDGTKTKPRRIHRVHELFRQKESCKGCFDPMVVSIGPYHHGKSELEEVERLKDSVALQFIKECKLYEFPAIYSKVEQISAAARKYYPEETVSRFDENAFTTLMLVDGCFVLQFIDEFIHHHEVKHMKSNIAAFVRRDLMLLENQLPYIVLEKLISLRFEDKHADDLIGKFIRSIRGNLFLQTIWIQTAVKFFHKCYSKLKDPSTIFKQGTANQTRHQKPVEEPINKDQPLHLLDIFLSKYINTENLKRRSFKETDPDWYSYPAAKELRALGIHFRPSSGEQFTDINFIPTLTTGLLFLPQIMIDDTTKSMLLNLVAYETSSDAPDEFCGLTSYICFMDSLIDQAEDVKVLRSNRIVFNLLGTDQQVAELFNNIARDLVPDPNAFLSAKKGIELHSRSRIRNGMAEFINTHFSSPWTFIAFLGATATIFLTFLETYVSVNDYCSGKGKQDHASFCAFF